MHGPPGCRWTETNWQAHRAGSRADSRAEAELDPGMLSLLRSRNELDLELYAYAVRLHAQQVSAAATAQPLSP